MRILNQIFIVIISVAAGIALYNGLSFSVIEAVIAGGVLAVLCMLVLEIDARHRAENRLRAAVEDLSRLLSQNAQAGHTLSVDVQEIKALNTDPRLTSVEADLSVLGTIVRQISEKVTEIELDVHARPEQAMPAPANADFETSKVQFPVEPVHEVRPLVSIAILKDALESNRIEPYMQPVVKLPQRKVTAYELLARLRLDDGQMATAADFLPHAGGERVMPQIDNLMIFRAVQIVRRLSARQKELALHVNLSPLTLDDPTTLATITEFLAANAALRDVVFFEFDQSDYDNLTRSQINALETITNIGFSVTLDNVTNLRLNFVDMVERNVRTVKITARQFLDNTRELTDIHIADIVDLLDRHDIDLIITRVENEEQVLRLLDERVSYASGDHFSAARPVRADVLEPEDPNGFDILPRDALPQVGE